MDSGRQALISGHPQDAKKVSITGAGRLRECFSLFKRRLRIFVVVRGGQRERLDTDTDRTVPLSGKPFSLMRLFT